MNDTSISSPSYQADSSEFAERLFDDVLGAFNVFAVHIGDRLGYYRALAQHGELTSAALAERTGTEERYTREWLEQQAAACILDVSEDKNGGTRATLLPATRQGGGAHRPR